MSFVTPSVQQADRSPMARETVYCNLKGNMAEGVGCPGLAAR